MPTPGWWPAVGATLPGAAWQRYRTHFAVNLMSQTPKSAWPGVKALLHSIYDQPDAPAVHAQFDRVVAQLADPLPTVAEYLDEARADILAAGPRNSARFRTARMWRWLRPGAPVATKGRATKKENHRDDSADGPRRRRR